MLEKIRFAVTDHRSLRHSDQWIFGTMIVGALLSLIAALVLSVEAIQLAKNPDSQLSCSVNVVINCATVAKSQYATTFGMPNSFFGLMAEPVVMTIAVLGLVRVRFPRWFMATAQVGYGLGFVYAYYLFGVSYFLIGALCPWCLLVTLSTTLVFASLLRYNLRENNLYLSKDLHKKAKAFIAKDYDTLAVATLIFLVVAAIIVKYGDGLFA
jgi:uncharacterized membrane protein